MSGEVTDRTGRDGEVTYRTGWDGEVTDRTGRGGEVTDRTGRGGEVTDRTGRDGEVTYRTGWDGEVQIGQGGTVRSRCPRTFLVWSRSRYIIPSVATSQSISRLKWPFIIYYFPMMMMKLSL